VFEGEEGECGRGAGRGFSNRSAGFGFLETARWGLG